MMRKFGLRLERWMGGRRNEDGIDGAEFVKLRWHAVFDIEWV
jgi:hypothetical protein